ARRAGRAGGRARSPAARSPPRPMLGVDGRGAQARLSDRRRGSSEDRARTPPPASEGRRRSGRPAVGDRDEWGAGGGLVQRPRALRGGSAPRRRRGGREVEGDRRQGGS